MKYTLTFLTLLLCTLSLFGQNISQKEKEKKAIEKEIESIDRLITQTSAKKKKNVEALVLTQKKIESRKRLIKEIDAEISQYTTEINSKSAELKRLEKRLDTLMKYHENMVLSAYKHRDNKVLFMYILSSENINQALRRWSYLKNISSSINQQASQIKLTQATIKAETERLDELKENSTKIKSQRTAEYNNLTTEEKKVGKMIADLTSKEKQMKKELKQKQKEVEKLNKEIERILAEAVKSTKKEEESPTATIDYQLSGKFAENKGKFPWPVNNGVITEKYGQNYHPVFKNIQLPFNNGINISCTSGSQACSIFDGVVKQILVMPGYNQCVLVQHGEYFTFYCKLDRVYVKNGEKISTGDKIGSIATNDSGNGELHFQLWKGTTKQNPEHWLKKR